jgi:cytochrome b561
MKSNSTTAPLSFPTPQRVLHWAMAALIGSQFLTGQFFDPSHEAGAGAQAGFSAPPLPILAHVGVGVTVLALAVARLFLRVAKGAPEPPSEEPRFFQFAAAGGHIALYALMFMTPITGLAAFFGHVGLAGRIHAGPLKWLLLALIATHVCAVAVHQFVWRTDVLRRMTRGV